MWPTCHSPFSNTPKPNPQVSGHLGELPRSSRRKRKEALSIGDYFKEVNYFGGAVQLGADLNNQDAWIQYPSQVPQDIQEPSYHLTRFPPEPVSLHLLYA